MQVKMQAKHSSQMASLIGKMLEQKTETDKHFRSETQREAHERLFAIPGACGDISAQLSITFNEARSVNQQNLLKIFSNVKLLARQALPLRGHGSEEDSNFTQLYILR